MLNENMSDLDKIDTWGTALGVGEKKHIRPFYAQNQILGGPAFAEQSCGTGDLNQLGNRVKIAFL